MLYIILPIIFAVIIGAAILINILIALVTGTVKNIVIADAFLITGLLIYFTYKAGLHIVFSILLGLVAGSIFVFLTSIPRFGKIFVTLCGIVWACGIYELIDDFGIIYKLSNAPDYKESDHVLTVMFKNDPIMWWAIVILLLLIFVGLHLKCVIKSLSDNDNNLNECYEKAPTEQLPVQTNFTADDQINKLSKELNLMVELNINSREQLASAIDKLENIIAERQTQIKKLSDELSALNQKISDGKQSDEELKRSNVIRLQIERAKSDIDIDKEKISQLLEISRKQQSYI